MEQMGLRFLSRNDINTFFEVNNNNFVKNNLDVVLKLVTFYTVAIFETDSVDQKIMFILDGEQVCKSIPEACEILFEKYINNSKETIDTTDEDDDEVGNVYEYRSTYKDIDELSQFKYQYHQNLAKKILDTPVAKYKITNLKYTAVCDICVDISEKYVDVWDIERDYGDIRGKIISQNDDWCETAGNYGNCMYKKEILESNDELHYNMFDFDEFDINISKVGYLEYMATFTHINKIHHAASMWAQTALVEFDESYIYENSFVPLNKVFINIIGMKDKLCIHTFYDAIDCL